jgi:hypothetical protein
LIWAPVITSLSPTPAITLAGFTQDQAKSHIMFLYDHVIDKGTI